MGNSHDIKWDAGRLFIIFLNRKNTKNFSSLSGTSRKTLLLLLYVDFSCPLSPTSVSYILLHSIIKSTLCVGGGTLLVLDETETGVALVRR